MAASVVDVRREARRRGRTRTGAGRDATFSAMRVRGPGRRWDPVRTHGTRPATSLPSCWSRSVPPPPGRSYAASPATARTASRRSRHRRPRRRSRRCAPARSSSWGPAGRVPAGGSSTVCAGAGPTSGGPAPQTPCGSRRPDPPRRVRPARHGGPLRPPALPDRLHPHPKGSGCIAVHGSRAAAAAAGTGVPALRRTAREGHRRHSDGPVLQPPAPWQRYRPGCLPGRGRGPRHEGRAHHNRRRDGGAAGAERHRTYGPARPAYQPASQPPNGPRPWPKRSASSPGPSTSPTG